jgi:hypothetical protein
LIKRTRPPRGVIVAHFILWYGFLRIFVDFFREYRTDLLGFPPGQEFNLFMTIAGAGMLAGFYRKKKSAEHIVSPTSSFIVSSNADAAGIWYKRIVFALILIAPTIIPGDWTHDIPARYGKRHPGLSYSSLYPKIDIYNETKQEISVEKQEIQK